MFVLDMYNKLLGLKMLADGDAPQFLERDLPPHLYKYFDNELFTFPLEVEHVLLGDDQTPLLLPIDIIELMHFQCHHYGL